jgi:hypothetical protein
LNFWSTESIFNQFSVFLKTLSALCICLQYKHPRSMKRVIRLDKPVTLLLLLWSHKCDFGAESRSRIIATSAVKGLNTSPTCWPTALPGPTPISGLIARLTGKKERTYRQGRMGLLSSSSIAWSPVSPQAGNWWLFAGGQTWCLSTASVRYLTDKFATTRSC